MTLTIRQADKLIASEAVITMTDAAGGAGGVVLIKRDRSHIEYRETSGHVGKMHLSDIAKVEVISSNPGR